jgi:hypothetical protein
MTNKLAIQPQIKHNQATKTCQDHICDIFQKHSHQPWIINQDYPELSHTIHHVTYAMPNERNAQRKAIHMLQRSSHRPTQEIKQTPSSPRKRVKVA